MRRTAEAHPHLEYRPSGFHWRRRWPAAARRMPAKGGSRTRCLLFSLRTHVVPDARTLAQRLTLLSDCVFAGLTERTMPIAPELMEDLLVGLCRFQIEAADLAREVAPTRSAEAAAYEHGCAMAALDTIRTAIFHRDREVARAPLRQVAARLGVALDESDEDWARLAMRALHAMLEAQEESLRRDQGVFSETRYLPAALAPPTHPPQASPLRAGPTSAPAARPYPGAGTSSAPLCAPCPPSGPATTPAPGAVAAPPPRDTVEMRPAAPAAEPRATATPAAPVPRSNMAAWGDQWFEAVAADGTGILAATEAYIAARCAGYRTFSPKEKAAQSAGASWARNSAGNVRATGRLMARILGDKDMREIESDELTRAFELMQRLPVHYGRSAKETRSPQEAADEADATERHNAERIRARMEREGASPGRIEAEILRARIARQRVATTYRHMQDFQRICVFLVRIGRLGENIMADQIWEKADYNRRELLQEDNKRETWCDHLDAFFRTPIFRQELEDPGDPLFWAPLLTLHMGMRSEECLQIATDDIAVIDGIPCIKLRQGAGQNLKSFAARRTLPIHENILKLGFMKLIELRKRQGEPRLFPWLERSSAKRTFTETFSKRFTRYRIDNRVYAENRDFHSFRTTFNHMLIESGCEDTQRRHLLGHVESDVGITSYKPKGFSKQLLLARVNAVKVDISAIRPPFGAQQAPGVTRLADRRGTVGN